MNEKIKEVAEQAGLSREFSVSGLWLADDQELERFAELVRADERDKCASDYLQDCCDAVEAARLEEREKLAKPEQDHGFDRTASHMAGAYVDTAQSDNQEPVAPPRKPWVALTHADLMKEFGYTDELLRITAYGVEKIIKDKNT